MARAASSARANQCAARACSDSCWRGAVVLGDNLLAWVFPWPIGRSSDIQTRGAAPGLVTTSLSGM